MLVFIPIYHVITVQELFDYDCVTLCPRSPRIRVPGEAALRRQGGRPQTNPRKIHIIFYFFLREE